MKKWFDTFFEEKQLDMDRIIEVEGSWGTNMIPVQVVVDTIKRSSYVEQKKIRDTFVRIDFRNGSINHFIDHLAKALAI